MNTARGPRMKASLTLWLACLIEWLLFLPVWVLLQSYQQSGQAVLPWMYILPLLALAGVLLRHLCNRKWKQLLSALLLGVASGFLFGELSIFALPFIACSVLFAYLGMTAASRNNRNGMYIAGIAVYFTATIINTRIPVFESNLSLLTWCGSLCLVLVLLDTNTSFLRYSSFAGESARLPAGIRRHNRMFVLLFIVVAGLLAAGGGKAVGMLLWNTVRMFMNWIIALFNGTEEPIQPEAAPPAQPPELPPAETHEPGLLAMIFEVLFYAIGAAAILVLLYYVFRWLYRNTGGVLRRALDALLSMLRRETPQEHNAFQDEEESIFAWGKTVQGIRDYWSSRLKLRRHSDRWEGMDGGRERVRWMYRHWLNSNRNEGYEVKGFLTPQETGADVEEWTGGKNRRRNGDSNTPAVPEGLIRLYNQARYGEEEPQAAEVTALKNRLK